MGAGISWTLQSLCKVTPKRNRRALTATARVPTATFRSSAHSMYGNPWLRLLRREVEALVREKHGTSYLKDRQAMTELARINRELERLKGQVAALEERKSKLIAGSGK